MKMCILLVCSVLGCSAPAEPLVSSDYDYAAGGGVNVPPEQSINPCLYGTPRLVTDDAGVSYVQWVPVDCTYSWVDPSDPVERAKWSIDPSPEQRAMVVHEQQAK